MKVQIIYLIESNNPESVLAQINKTVLKTWNALDKNMNLPVSRAFSLEDRNGSKSKFEFHRSSSSQCSEFFQINSIKDVSPFFPGITNQF